MTFVWRLRGYNTFVLILFAGFKKNIIKYWFTIQVASCSFVAIAPRVPVWTNKMELHYEMWEAAGRTVELKCPADGFPIPKISWLKDDQPITRSDDRPIGAVSSVTWLVSELALRCLFACWQLVSCIYYDLWSSIFPVYLHRFEAAKSSSIVSVVCPVVCCLLLLFWLPSYWLDCWGRL